MVVVGNACFLSFLKSQTGIFLNFFKIIMLISAKMFILIANLKMFHLKGKKIKNDCKLMIAKSG